MTDEKYVDPTNAGLMLIGIVSVVFGVLGFLLFTESDAAGPLGSAADTLALFFGLVILLYSVFCASKTGNMPCMMAFGFVGTMLASIGMSGIIPGIQALAASYVMLMILGIVFAVFMMLMYLVGAPKMLVLVFLWACLFFEFFGLYVNNPGTTNALLFGIFGLLTGIFAMYLSFAEATQKLPFF